MAEDQDNCISVQVQHSKFCCAKCKYFESRTGFCRYNPPVPMATMCKNVQFVTAVYPKISFPQFDFCYKFEEKDKEQ